MCISIIVYHKFFFCVCVCVCGVITWQEFHLLLLIGMS